MDIKFPKNIFHSARLKLTLFYLAAFIAFTLTLTICTRIVVQHVYLNSESAQRTEFSRLFNQYDSGIQFGTGLPSPNNNIANIQNRHEEAIKHLLTEDLWIINLCAIAIGGLVSWWYAGRTLEPIKQAHEQQKRFASDASHELRTPLASMKIENEVFLRQKDFTKDEARLQIQSNLEEVQRLENLSTSLLALSQYEEAKLELKPTPIKKVVDDALQATEKLAQSKKTKVTVNVNAKNVLADKASLTELVTIILDNALKYSGEDSKVEILGSSSSRQYELIVRDYGGGISEGDLPHIFERLYRGDKARSTKTGGYGLGLSLAAQIAKVNDALIAANNHTSGGAQFTLTISLA